jgi:hypothetical protein
MVQQTLPAGVPDAPRPEQDRPGAGRSWWRRPWVIPLWAIVTVTLIYIWQHYIRFDPAQATVQLPEEHPWKFPVLMVHIVCGSIALVAGSLQLWPRIRQTRPAVHRTIGRIYLLGGVLPSVVAAWALFTILGGGPGTVGRLALGAFWTVTSALAFIKIRQRQYAEHRKYMLYSYALTLDAFSVRLLIWFGIEVVGFENLDAMLFFEFVAWGGWMFNLLVAYAWIEYTGRRSRRAVRVT